MSDDAAIRAEGVVVVFAAAEGNVAALRGLDLAVEPGEVIAVVGPSGSGKTTLLRCLAGIERPSAGSLTAFGVQLHDAPRGVLATYRSRTVGVVAQHYVRALTPDLTIREIVALRPALLGWPAGERHARAQELLDRVGLGDRAGATRRELSGGEQQRVAVCAALAARPQLLLADEPTGELDAGTGHDLLELMRELARDAGATVVLATHDLEAAATCDRLLRMADGRVVLERRGADGPELAVVGAAGIVQIPAPDRSRAGITDRAVLAVEKGRVVLEANGAVASPVEASPPKREVEVPLTSRPNGGPPVVSLAGASRTYGTGRQRIQAVRSVTVDFAPSGFHVIRGPSGSGKTTLLHLIGGLEHPDEGSVTVLGQPLGGLTRTELADFRRVHVGVVGQSPNLVPFLRARENVELTCLIRGQDDEEAARAAEQALTEMGLGERLDQRADRLSGGERQRVAMARAFATRPALVLADEPTANLDQVNAALAADLLVRATREHGTTVICATHDAIVAQRADTVTEMRSGEVVSTFSSARGG